MNILLIIIRNLLKKKKTIEKNFDNDLLQDKVEKINKIVSWFIDKEGNNQDIKSEDLRTNFIGFLKTLLLNNYLILILKKVVIRIYLIM